LEPGPNWPNWVFPDLEIHPERGRQEGGRADHQPQVFGRPYLAPPGVAAEPLKILRDAVTTTIAGQGVPWRRRGARARRGAVLGRESAAIVEQLYATPKATVERAKDSIKP